MILLLIFFSFLLLIQYPGRITISLIGIVLLFGALFFPIYVTDDLYRHEQIYREILLGYEISTNINDLLFYLWLEFCAIFNFPEIYIRFYGVFFGYFILLRLRDSNQLIAIIPLLLLFDYRSAILGQRFLVSAVLLMSAYKYRNLKYPKLILSTLAILAHFSSVFGILMYYLGRTINAKRLILPILIFIIFIFFSLNSNIILTYVVEYFYSVDFLFNYAFTFDSYLFGYYAQDYMEEMSFFGRVFVWLPIILSILFFIWKKAIYGRKWNLYLLASLVATFNPIFGGRLAYWLFGIAYFDSKRPNEKIELIVLYSALSLANLYVSRDQFLEMYLTWLK